MIVMTAAIWTVRGSIFSWSARFGAEELHSGNSQHGQNRDRRDDDADTAIH